MQELTTLGCFDVILADCPWRYEFHCIPGKNRQVQSHYETMALADICAMPVREIAADPCVLFLWATMPKLRDALTVIDAWGFDYQDGICWDKVLPGVGYWYRGQFELLMIATRGNIEPPPSRKTVPVLHERKTPARSLRQTPLVLPHDRSHVPQRQKN